MKKIVDVPIPSSAALIKKPTKSRSKKASLGIRMRYTDMITSAVKALKKPHGSSRQAIAKYVQNNFDVPAKGVSRHVTKNLKQMVSNEQLVLASGIGAAGRFKVNKNVATRAVSAGTNKRKTKKVATPIKRVIKKSSKKKSPIKKKTVKRTTKKPAKPGKRTSKKKAATKKTKSKK